MKNALSILFSISILLILSTLLSGCQAIGDIFGAGVWTGVILVVVIVVVIIVIISRIGKK